METSEFVIGQRWVSHSDTALGLGIVTDISGRRVTLGFPAADEERTYAIDNAPLSRIVYQQGEEIETFEGERYTVRAVETIDGVLMYHADDGENIQPISEVKLAGSVNFSAPHQRLFAGQFDRNGAFRLRVATLQHMDRLRASPAQGLIGARTQHLPHQLYIAHEVARRHAPRVLLADEVGLGKTIEAGLILHYQLQTGRARRALIVVPDSLIHQWLVEMLRRFNLRFSIVDQARYDDLKAEEDDVDALMNHIFGDDDAVNPFEADQLVLCSLDFLVRSEKARKDAFAAGWDLMVVDEAHHLAWSPEQASPEYEVVERLSEASQGLLLLTATPEQIGLASHFARLRLLDPARFHDLEAFRQEEQQYEVINQVVRRLQQSPETLSPEDQEALAGWLGDELPELLGRDDAYQSVIDALLDRHGTGRVLFRNTRAAIQGFPERQPLPEPLPCPALYDTERYGLEGLAPEQSVPEERWLAEDPRVAWLEKKLAGLRPAKVVVICARASTAMALEHYLQLRAGIRSAAFHEHLSLIERDRAAAYFADSEQGAQALICSEIGSEGRNFQFAHHLVLFDLPANPDLLEQRIGRLDRIGQTDAIRIHIPYLQGTSQEVQYRWFQEGLNAFAESCAVGVAVQEHVHGEWQLALDGDGSRMEPLVAATAAETARLKEMLHNGRDALIELNSCRTEEASALIADIEAEENAAGVRDYMLQAFDILGVDLEDHSEHADILKPGEQFQTGMVAELPEDGLTVTWDRQQALQREDMAFMSWEHPVVTGVMDSVTSAGLGKAALANLSVKALPPGTLLLEAVFAVHCPAPETLQLTRYLPVSPLRLVVDVNGRDLSKALPHDRLNELCSNIRRRTAQAIVPKIRAEVETMVDHAERLADPHLASLRERALDRVEEGFGPEIRRLEALRKVNPAIRDQEVDFLRDQLASARSSLEHASLALEGIRVIVTS
ncbi:RNA polymerase-associated protein RapA [Marinobacter daepoensis]|uniref:RNA polymerase-associated protein RapA n=1 Tax=Marinobacter daepoensis TaxID=262077 RepID=A0ABS3BEF6_9GAMM|nr:RNA polymerase-associated protein RapA [Marinobacter daepoensis]MBN7770224.1 RNA polymerase-associated protein RapA [Marinobacter daepoensis]MBY6079670.1 RNA polymerase-associated protein RapA [Marinobacter daepoensis]